MTIRKRLSLVLLGLTLFLLLATTSLQYFEMRRVLEREVVDRLHVLTDLKSDQVFDLFNKLKADITTLSGKDDIRSILQPPSPLLHSTLPHDPNMGNLLLVDKHGHLVYLDNPNDRSRYLEEGEVPPGPWQKTLEGGEDRIHPV